MRLVIDKYEAITQKKLEKPLKIVLISDIHVAKKRILIEDFNLKRVLKGVKKISGIDFFVLGGDYVNTAKDYLDERAKNSLFDFVRSLAKIAPVVMIKGNHDVYFRTKKTDAVYSEFLKIENTFLVDNKQIEMSGIKITGFSPSRETYHARKHGKHAQTLALDQFKKCKFNFNEKDFNLILTHSPLMLANKTMEKEAKDFFEKSDIILSGHLHNGLIASRNSELILKILKNENSRSPFKKVLKRYADSGIWYGYKTCFLIRGCRGARYFGLNNNTVYLPSSKNYSKLKLFEHEKEAVQITTKAVNKYAVVPLFAGRPSVLELKIRSVSPKN